MSKNISFGRAGEDRASEYLESNDYRIIERNFRCNFGEIDIIAYKDGTVCFIEVKSRHNISYGRPCESVTHTKQRHIYKIADYYLLTHTQELSHRNNNQAINTATTAAPVTADQDIRFDIIEIIAWSSFETIELEHIINAF